jgi:CRP-like cAMP-binding protein
MDSVAQSANGFLASLSAEDFDTIRPHLRTVQLSQGRLLAKVGESIRHVYLPHGGVVSLVVELETGDRVEVGMIGRDGILGGSGAFGEPIALTSAVVLLPGPASILDIDRLRGAAERSAALRTTLARHGQALVAQARQTAACNAAHAVEARLARWLLRVRDLAGSDRFTLAQELMAQMIGARRNSVSLIAHILQQAHHIRYTRGHIEIIDRDGLSKTACECYAAVRAHYERLRLI